MFTGIIEGFGVVDLIEKDGENIDFTLTSQFTDELKIDQSLAHNGVCLTVVKLDGEKYTVTAIEETLQKTNLNELKFGQHVNLERCMKLGDRLDICLNGVLNNTYQLRSMHIVNACYLINEPLPPLE